MITRRTRLAVAAPALLAALATPAAMGYPAAQAATVPAATTATVSGLDLAIAPQATISARASLPADPGYRLTGEFGDAGPYWASGYHTGLDFADSTGSPLRAITDGVVVSAGYEGSYGNKTVIRDANGNEWWFCHQDAVKVSVGDRVSPGEVIGTIGSTGNVTGPHLHLEFHPQGAKTAGDPYAALKELGLQP